MSDSSLSKVEIEIMDAVWRLGRATVREVCDALTRPLAYTTVMTLLDRLYSKRWVLKRTKVGRAFVYKPKVTRDEVSARVSRELGPHLLRGSLKSFVMALIEDDAVTKDDVAELQRAIEKVESNE